MVPINSLMLTVTLYYSVSTTLVYSDTIFSPLHDVITAFGCIMFTTQLTDTIVQFITSKVHTYTDNDDGILDTMPRSKADKYRRFGQTSSLTWRWHDPPQR